MAGPEVYQRESGLLVLDHRLSTGDAHRATHVFADTDQGLLALHHTLGNRPNQAARGDHTHPGGLTLDTVAANIKAVQDQAASVGSTGKVAHSDHLHPITKGAPTNQAFGDAATQGAGPGVALSDHKHGMPANPVPGYGSPVASAVGDASADGVATTLARSDHKHAREAYGVPGSSAVGDAASAGVATTNARSDHKHGREAFALPSTQAMGDAANAGVALTIPRSDHKHGLPAFAARADRVSANQAGTDGVAATVSRSDHLHAGYEQVVELGGVAYTNATTSFTDVTNLSLAVVANAIYEVIFEGHWQASAVTVALKLNVPALSSQFYMNIMSQIWHNTGVVAPSASMGYFTSAPGAFPHTGNVAAVAAANFYFMTRIYFKTGVSVTLPLKLQAAASAAGSITIPASGARMTVKRVG